MRRWQVRFSYCAKGLTLRRMQTGGGSECPPSPRCGGNERTDPGRGMMDLTPENKKYIDGLSYYSLLSRWRFAPIADPWFQGETGTYWSKRLSEKRQEHGQQIDQLLNLLNGVQKSHDGGISNSKALGWKA